MMTAVALIGCGLLFLVEAALGMFWPGIYLLIGTTSRGEASPRLRLIGGGLLVCGVVCLAVGAPPREPAQWFLLAAGAALVFKGMLMIGFPRSLKDNPAAISADPLRWKVKCGLRAGIGFALICWGVILLWQSGQAPAARSAGPNKALQTTAAVSDSGSSSLTVAAAAAELGRETTE